ncbi:sugar ABC transporter substrate-binding protein [Streptomyces viridochromogenes]|uniref:Sugar ABC transporter substrate-binding protein n=1 Tax=Streptomyces viridochromogenes TaxID=1938 RepID=A0A0J7ZAM7_STRVR|nr:sugar ABC transporter substrate-binding protein [Streptomyces viridochromogenes]KOG11772.1 sugar ABC transporter substrate-binding protein [Streptomyces viridochromogenes]KOG24087.1 sugar ABC transporter substrate-binding protein [Streptomyces viridochromogenes]
MLALGPAACADRSPDTEGTTVTVAAVDFMRTMDKLVDDFELSHPDTHVNFVFLPENTLRARVPKDIASEAGRYDVVAIGPYEAPIWASRGWLTRLDRYAGQGDYDMRDFIPTVRRSLAYDGGQYAVPYYGESSFLMYRKDLFAKAGLTMPERPSWQQIARLAKRLHDPENGVAGICLRGGPGWGNLLMPLNTVILTFGGRWYDEHWNPRLTSPETKHAVRFYVDLVRRYGQPRAAEAGPAECLSTMRQGKAAMWYDSTALAGSLEDPKTSEVAGRLGYAPAPVECTASSGWLWAWSLAIPVTAKDPQAAWEFVSWATSKRYPKLYGERLGWVRVPPGGRLSTYRLPEYQDATQAFVRPALDALDAVNPRHPGTHEQPWVGMSYVGIPEYAGLGNRVSAEISAAIAGRQSVDEALAKAQIFARDVVEGGGYRK